MDSARLGEMAKVTQRIAGSLFRRGQKTGPAPGGRQRRPRENLSVDCGGLGPGRRGEKVWMLAAAVETVPGSPWQQREAAGDFRAALQPRSTGRDETRNSGTARRPGGAGEGLGRWREPGLWGSRRGVACVGRRPAREAPAHRLFANSRSPDLEPSLGRCGSKGEWEKRGCLFVSPSKLQDFPPQRPDLLVLFRLMDVSPSP